MSSTTDTSASTPGRLGRHSAVPPAVSVIIPAFNVASFIGEALESALSQTFKDYEIIVINDGSPDTEALERVLSAYHENILYLKQHNRGAAAARNTGLHVARGEFVAFLDADDLWLPNYLESQMRFLENDKRCDLVYADAMIFGESPLAGKTYMETSPSNGEVNFSSLITQKCNVITSGVVARKRLIDEVGCFDEELHRAHDFDLWLRLVRHGARVSYQREILLRYRVRSDSLSGDEIQRVERELEAYDKIERHLDLTAEERKLMTREVERLQADLKVAEGKRHLSKGEFKEAEGSFREATGFHRKLKLRLVLVILHYWPRLLHRVYKARRMTASGDFFGFLFIVLSLFKDEF